MNDHPHLTHDDLVLHYYGDAGPDAARFDAHLVACHECRAARDRLTRALSLVDATSTEEPDSSFEARVWARLRPALAPSSPWWRRALDTPRMWWVPATGAVAALVAAFASGWMLRTATAPPTESVGAVSGRSASPTTPDAPRVQTRVLVLAVGDHLDRAEVILSELMHAGPSVDEVDRTRAADLVAASRLFRQTATQTGDETLDEVLEEIERVLVEVANAPADASSDEWEALRRRVESRGILFRVRVLGNELRTRHQPAIAPVSKGKTS